MAKPVIQLRQVGLHYDGLPLEARSIVRLCDGTRSVAEIIRLSEEKRARPILERLAGLGLISDYPNRLPPLKFVKEPSVRVPVAVELGRAAPSPERRAVAVIQQPAAAGLAQVAAAIEARAKVLAPAESEPLSFTAEEEAFFSSPIQVEVPDTWDDLQ
jgi:hypothetical protein